MKKNLQLLATERDRKGLQCRNIETQRKIKEKLETEDVNARRSDRKEEQKKRKIEQQRRNRINKQKAEKAVIVTIFLLFCV